MKLLSSPAFAMQPPTRNVSAATPARATSTPPTPASSARSGQLYELTFKRLSGYANAAQKKIAPLEGVTTCLTNILGSDSPHLLNLTALARMASESFDHDFILVPDHHMVLLSNRTTGTSKQILGQNTPEKIEEWLPNLQNAISEFLTPTATPV